MSGSVRHNLLVTRVAGLQMKIRKAYFRFAEELSSQFYRLTI